jgi:hypothetical protein
MTEGEHRHSERVNRHLIMRYRVAGSNSAWLASPLQDISQSGARFFSEEAFATGTLLECQLLLPALKEPLALFGHVVRQQPTPLHLTEVAMTFDQTEAASRQALEKAVAFFLKK